MLLLGLDAAFAQNTPMSTMPAYTSELITAHTGFDGETCWVHARAGAIPPRKTGESPTVVLTMQKLLLSGSDVFYPIHSMHTRDLGRTWSVPADQSAFARQRHDERTESAVCDFFPRFHAKTNMLLGTGHTAYYVDNRIPKGNRPRLPVYATYDEAAEQWRPWQTLRLPDAATPEGKFYNCGAGCTQRWDLADGRVLLPIYFNPGGHHSYATVVRCEFDGRELRYIEHRSELTVPAPRGLGEPSLTRFGGRFYLTLRNDQAGYISVSDDGLNFTEPKAWTFDDGSDLGNYNTQQHWVTHSGGLFLVYTRRGLNNDHVFRHRAPLVMAQVDEKRLCVLRDTERVIIPERGARLGNFGVTEVSEHETWVTVCEWMQNAGTNAKAMMEKLGQRRPEDPWTPRSNQYYAQECKACGSDNAVFAARIRWEKPNSMLSE